MPTEYSLAFIADAIDGEAIGEKEKRISGVAPFDAADAHQITFAGGSKFLKRIEETQAGAIIVPKGFQASDKNLIGVNNPPFAFAKVVALYHPMERPASGVSNRSIIGDDLQIEAGASIGAFTTIGDRVTIGTRSVIRNGVFIGDDVTLGEDVVIGPNVTILNGCRLGNRVIVHSGTVIGSDGYGFVPDGGRYHKIPQIGIVQIDDDVEIGACNTIDRATFGRTWIQRGVKTDNLVHIAHNVVIGEDSLIVAQVGIAGSTQVGHHAIFAGQAGISGHLTIGNNVTVGPMTGVGKSISDGEIVSSGSPSMPHRTWLRVQRVIPALPDMKKKIAALEKQIAALKKTVDQH